VNRILVSFVSFVLLAAAPVAASAAPLTTETDAPVGCTGYTLCQHTLTFTVTNDGATPILFSERTFSYNQHPLTSPDKPRSPGGTFSFAHGVTITTDPGCSAFGQHLRLGGTGYGGTQCGSWLVPAGETRSIATTVPSWYSSAIQWGASWAS
jgi:hypothetical protein